MAPRTSIPEEQEEIAAEFELLDDWRDRIDYVLELGRRLPPIPEQHRIDANKVKGCQSQVWMVAEVDQDRRLRLLADSDAYIVKGLIALLLRLYSGRRADEVLASPPSVFDRIGLGAHLSPARANGLHAMVKRIRQLATAAEQGVEVPAAS